MYRHLLTILLLFSSLIVYAQVEEYDSLGNKIPRKEQFTRGIKNQTFIEKGQWLVGSTFRYSESTNDNYKFMLIEDWSGQTFNFAVSPFFAYFIKDNFAIGGRFTYTRKRVNIDEMNIKIDDDLSFRMDGIKNEEHMFYSSIFIRNYLPLGDGKRFGLFNEVRLSYGYGQSKETVLGEAPHHTTGVYSTTHEFNIGVAPGMTAFINDMVALEVSIGVLGFTNKWVHQTENQVEEGSRNVNKANFNIDMFSLNIGLAFYL
ncbi:hypothetical protein [Flammeovirga kamogawensis]|uniref:Outer membrane protein beta-barrel domain-containing protein n=1 Tax=Flammeovirga kamogawensis TaxID=373891 RepID=A0ABX8H146_9BACT|nr:hypothetical protein [Flammeovirga kamogawensis]MBB6462643.1 hypothetical protein [Flammeovirga kamogawensis]QWG09613.1 hypothetical protein KM029_23705 [Flammeovirga kamogawensis]TRX65127.1 hypothetical protein EO216_21605 [Flammeovirga kamogawensis]